MNLENIVAYYRQVPIFPKRVFYRRMVNWTESIRHPKRNFKQATIKLNKQNSFQINLDINTWLGKEIFYFGKFELFTYRFFLENVKPGSVVVDVGANIGFYSIMSALLSRPAGQVHCFEPTNKFFALLEKNYSLNGLSTTLLNKVALGDHRTEISILVGEQTAHVSDSIGGEKVEQITLDEYFSRFDRGPDLIKIDVDGHEFPILKGAKKTINEFKPLLCVEVTQSQPELNNIFQFIQQAGYVIFHEDDPHQALGYIEICQRLKTMNSFNLIAVHHECDYQLW